MNALYNKILKLLTPKGSAALMDAQQDWNGFRDKTAEAYAAGEQGGSIEGIMYIRCQEGMTRKRIKELREIFLSVMYP